VTRAKCAESLTFAQTPRSQSPGDPNRVETSQRVASRAEIEQRDRSVRWEQSQVPTGLKPPVGCAVEATVLGAPPQLSPDSN